MYSIHFEKKKKTLVEHLVVLLVVYFQLHQFPLIDSVE